MATVLHAPTSLTVLEPAEPRGRRGLHVQGTGLGRVLAAPGSSTM
jgi:hypothetical protein